MSFNKKRSSIMGMRVASGLGLSLITIAIIICSFWKGDVTAAGSRIDVSPDGSELVFSARGMDYRDLYLLNLGTGSVNRLTEGRDYENYPSFSPDGKQVVFQRGASQNSPLYVCTMDLKTGAIVQLTHGSSTGDKCPRFSNDGKGIVFERDTTRVYTTTEDPWRHADIYTMSFDGARIHRVTHSGYGCNLYPSMNSLYSNIFYSYFYSTNEIDLKSVICEVTRNGAECETIQHPGEVNYDPFLFRDGRYIAFVSNQGEDRRNICIAPVAPGANPTVLRTSDYANWAASPTVTRDGRWIYFIGGNPPEIWRVNRKGTNFRRIADTSIFTDPLGWHPEQ